MQQEDSQNENRFKGGGTPIQSLQPQGAPQGPPQMQQPQGAPQGPPQMQQPQGAPQVQRMTQQQYQQMQQQRMQQQQMQQQQMQRMQNPKGMIKENYTNEKSVTEKFKDFTNTSWQKFLCIVILFIVLGNSWVYDCEKSLIPLGMRFGNPPLIAVIFNAIIAGIFYLVISKFV